MPKGYETCLKRCSRERCFLPSSRQFCERHASLTIRRLASQLAPGIMKLNKSVARLRIAFSLPVTGKT
jgi:hypothetical protein